MGKKGCIKIEMPSQVAMVVSKTILLNLPNISPYMKPQFSRSVEKICNQLRKSCNRKKINPLVINPEVNKRDLLLLGLCLVLEGHRDTERIFQINDSKYIEARRKLTILINDKLTTKSGNPGLSEKELLQSNTPEGLERDLGNLCRSRQRLLKEKQRKLKMADRPLKRIKLSKST